MADKKNTIKKTSAKENKGFSVNQLISFSKSINQKAETDPEYQKVVEIASEKWKVGCGYELY